MITSAKTPREAIAPCWATGSAEKDFRVCAAVPCSSCCSLPACVPTALRFTVLTALDIEPEGSAMMPFTKLIPFCTDASLGSPP
eukprot:1779205-Rhodomonas_salina.1